MAPERAGVQGWTSFGASSDWARFLAGGRADGEIAQIRRHGRTGRPLDIKRCVEPPERRLDRALLPRKPGHKPKDADQTSREMSLLSPEFGFL